MKKILVGVLFTALTYLQLQAQQKCISYNYQQDQLLADPLLKSNLSQIEDFTRQRLQMQSQSRTGSITQVITIPVVFHVLYHQPEENIPYQRLQEQIDALNRDFRRRNTDTFQTPANFLPYAADMEIEFQLARSDPYGKSTNGVVRRYTPIRQWAGDDKIKFASEYGDDSWDSKSYLNIWVCNLFDALAYSSFPGGSPERDGVVLNYRIVGKSYYFSQYSAGRTAVHEVGHWLNLNHLWGDTFCGDDNVDDTPRQSTYTAGCPHEVRISCNNSPTGDMYMNYMDFTGDACLNMFTEGQKQRARTLFEPGGWRYAMLSSKGFDTPFVFETPLPEFHPTWLNARAYPNPATSQLTIYFDYDERWLGKKIFIMDMNGNLVIRKIINNRIQEIDISKLIPGVYFVCAEKKDDRIFQKFIKL